MRNKVLCNAHARSTGLPCRCKALLNGRCRLHGGLSSGPRTSDGKAKIAEATRSRMLNGQSELAKAGFQRWLNAGGREHLQACAMSRKRIKKIRLAYDAWKLQR